MNVYWIRLARWLLLAGLSLLLLACEGAAVATPPPVTITVAGSSSMAPVLKALTDEYVRQRPNVVFDLRGGGSTLGEETIRTGRIDIAASTLFPPDSAAGRPALPGDEQLVRTPIGIDGLALIVHPSNSLDALSLVQARDLYNGRVLNWQALGSDAGEVVLVSREDGSAARSLFESRVMGDERVSLTAVVMPTSADVVDFVAGNPAAIGYVSRAYVASGLPDAAAANPALPVKVLALEGRTPTGEALIEQQYVLTQPLYLITRGNPPPALRQFIDFVLSPAGQAIVARYHAPIR